MKKDVSLALIATLVLCVTVAGQPGYCESADTYVTVTHTPNYYYFAGFSNIIKTGDCGPASMHNACKAKYGQGARMCTTQEILTSWKLPAGQDKKGWVNPSNLIVTPLPDGNFLGQDTPSGIAYYTPGYESASGALNCLRWTQKLYGAYGIALNGTNGSLQLEPCSEALPVACCNR